LINGEFKHESFRSAQLDFPALCWSFDVVPLVVVSAAGFVENFHSDLGEDLSREPGDGHQLAVLSDFADDFELLCEAKSSTFLGCIG
jgi:hypothetical protein